MESLPSALAWLDAVLERACRRARELFGPDGAADPYRGLTIGDDEPAVLLARAPGIPLLAGGPVTDPPPLSALRDTFGLDAFEVALCVVALAPELDLRYERLYGYLQDDVGRRRATVDLALNLLCANATDKIARRAHLAPGAPLVRHGVVSLVTDPRHAEPPLLAQFLKFDPTVLSLLLGQREPAGLLAAVARFVPDPVAVPPQGDRWPAIVALARSEPIAVGLDGAPGSGRAATAAALAAALGRPLLEFDGAHPAANAAIDAAFRHARFTGAIVHVRDAGRVDDTVLSAAITNATAPTVLSGGGPARVRVTLPTPDVGARRVLWRHALASVAATADDDAVDRVAARFVLGPGRIAAAAAEAGAEQRLTGEVLRAPELLAAARRQGGNELEGLARRIVPTRGWADLVLDGDRVEQLHELCSWVEHRATVHQTWGFASKLGLARGINALFAGPPGTGKSLAAEVIAGELGLNLFAIDLATVVSKYIGETEKNLARIFDAARRSNAILLFDEADALFGKRSEVRDAHDRYANIEISYLLQRMESYDGVAVLTTNRRRDVDEAFIRRLHFAVEFPLPDESARRQIWEAIWPAGAPRAADLDLGLVAARFALPGGNIRNIALAAAFLAAADGQVVTTAHVLAATRREYRKLGTLSNDDQFEL